MDQYNNELFPLAMSIKQANKVLGPEKGCPDEIRELPAKIMREMLDLEMSPLQAQAVLVMTWRLVLMNARLCFPLKTRQVRQNCSRQE